MKQKPLDRGFESPRGPSPFNDCLRGSFIARNPFQLATLSIFGLVEGGLVRLSGKITIGLTAIILVVAVGTALLSTGTFLGSRTSTITHTVSANSTQTQTQTETIFSTRNDTTTTTSTQTSTSTEVSTSTSYSTESTTVTTTATTLPVLSKDPSVLIQ